MLKRRIVATLLVHEGWVVQSHQFGAYLPIGRPEIVAEYLDRWGADELCLLDCSAARRGGPDSEMVARIADRLRIPLTVGGGIQAASHAADVIRAGADRVCITGALQHDVTLLAAIGDLCGVQAVVAGIDYRGSSSGGIQVVSMPREFTGTIADWVGELVSAGAGEILLHAVARDGMGCGFDIAVSGEVSRVATVPVVASGGAGLPVHFEELFAATSVAGGAAGNLFTFCEQSISYVKGYLSTGIIPIRIEGIPSYTESQFDCRGRPLGKGDEALAALRFRHIEDELP